jgi:hypothetical protein
MRVLATLPQDDLNDVPAATRSAEAAGYDGLVTMENRNEPFLALGVAAVNTTRIGLATGIAIAFSGRRQHKRPCRHSSLTPRGSAGGSRGPPQVQLDDPQRHRPRLRRNQHLLVQRARPDCQQDLLDPRGHTAEVIGDLVGLR